MEARARVLVLATALLAATLAVAGGCDSEDDCVKCCKCSNDNSPLVYRPQATDECLTCEEQCQALADREFMGQEFDNAEEIGCDD